MKLPNHPLAEIFKSAPLDTIPNSDTKAYLLLSILADGKSHPRIVPKLGESMRSALQILRGDGYHWLINSVFVEGVKTTYLQLDPRHLSGDPQQDAQARLIRKKLLKHESHEQSKQGRRREPKARLEDEAAQAEYFKSLGNAANDEQ